MNLKSLALTMLSLTLLIVTAIIFKRELIPDDAIAHSPIPDRNEENENVKEKAEVVHETTWMDYAEIRTNLERQHPGISSSRKEQILKKIRDIQSFRRHLASVPAKSKSIVVEDALSLVRETLSDNSIASNDISACIRTEAIRLAADTRDSCMIETMVIEIRFKKPYFVLYDTNGKFIDIYARFPHPATWALIDLGSGKTEEILECLIKTDPDVDSIKVIGFVLGQINKNNTGKGKEQINAIIQRQQDTILKQKLVDNLFEHYALQM